MRVFSFGGGAQSTAVLVLSAERILPYTHFVLANVGDDSENPATLEYVEQVAKPYAEAHGLTIVEVKRTRKQEEAPTLYQVAMNNDVSSIPIPVYLGLKGPGSRNCTSEWKIKVIEKWMRQHAGATKENRVPLGVGISVDESHRMRTDDPEREPYLKKEYPLIDLYYTRAMCQEVIMKAGLPLAPKSSCWFCPYKRPREWAKMRSEYPALWDKAVALEQRIVEKRVRAGKEPAYLTASNAPLEHVIPLNSANMFDDEDPMACESGYCMT
jgi:hypothetical protein